jgi:hypothetical protein
VVAPPLVISLAPKRAAALVALLVTLIGCGNGGSDQGETGGSAGSEGGLVRAIPGLWEGQSNGVDVCFFVGADGLSLTSVGSDCNVTDASGDETRSFDLRVEGVGKDHQVGNPCSFELATMKKVPIEPQTLSFRVDRIPSSDGEATLSFSGQLSGEQASGVARFERDSSYCEVGWSALKAAPCDQAAIDTCFALQQCCLSILVNPVFFESCNSVVLQCDQLACQALLDGYPRCAERE